MAQSGQIIHSNSADGDLKNKLIETPTSGEGPQTSDRPSSPKSKREAKILVMGKSGVGKSAIVVKYVTKRFIGDYAHSDTLCVCSTEIDGKPANLHILDTGGGLDSETDRHEMVEWAEGYMVVCSVTDKDSLYEAEQTFQYIADINAHHRHPVVLVANKCELYHQRTVSESDIRHLAKKLSCPFFETSASESYTSVLNAFSCLYREIRAQQKRRERRKALLCVKNANRMKQSIRDTLRTLADFRSRTNTF